MGAGWAGWSDVVIWKTRIYDSCRGLGEKRSQFTDCFLSGFAGQIVKQAVVFGFSHKTSKLSSQQHFITHSLQHCKGISSGKKPQIIKK